MTPGVPVSVGPLVTVTRGIVVVRCTVVRAVEVTTVVTREVKVT
ncbi:hypothetical protein V496_09595, partial [Pseudogymnoascus sp. VKM F-4515 (FW-2607)]